MCILLLLCHAVHSLTESSLSCICWCIACVPLARQVLAATSKLRLAMHECTLVIQPRAKPGDSC